MTVTLIKPSFSGGEMSPSLYGRTDLAKFHTGASTLRNSIVNYRGGTLSRAGTMFVGASRQTGRAFPPRLIPFRFSLTQSYPLEFGHQYIRFISNGAYVTEAPFNISAITQANPAVVTAVGHNFANGDWIFISGVGGMTTLNGRTFVASGVSGSTFQLKDIFGNFINSLALPAYTSGGTAARIYTIASPYAETDLPLLKFAQSADVLSIVHPTYPPYDLTRIANTNWTLTQTAFTSSINPPTQPSVVASTTTVTTSSMTTYQYVVTSVSATTGEESQASAIATVTNSVNIAVTAGTNTVSWNATAGAGNYNVYRAEPAIGSTATVPIGSLFGYVGTALGVQFIDSNIVPAFTQTPPLHENPFAPGAVIGAFMSSGGTGYAQNTTTVTITTGTGSGAVLIPVVITGAVTAIIVQNPGQGYRSTDTVNIIGAGTGAVVNPFLVGPTTGTYPGVVAYFQERRVYASTTNNPDTYYMSQPGAFTNFDSSIPVTDSDAIVGTPWATQVNGIQAMVPMPGGLVILTGQGAWQLSGGQPGIPVTPSNQFAQPQAYNGCSAILPPIVINYDILYVQSKGATVRDLSYNFFVNIYTGTDITLFSSHLFTAHTLNEWAYAEEPFKVVWAIRDDGTLLALTYLKEQEIVAWSRNDTNGQFVSVCSVTEPPVDAVYFATQRYITGRNAFAYYVERMDNREWISAEDCWCVDCGLSLPMRTPGASLSASSAQGTGGILTITPIVGGSGYVNPSINITDPTGSGAIANAVLTGGVITSVTVVTPGSNYTSPQFTITDSAGHGAGLAATIDHSVTLTASTSVFSSANVGDVVRIGGGIGTVTQFISGTILVANFTQAITAVVPNDPTNRPLIAISGTWSITTPVSSVTGLDHLEGMTVSILADGSVAPQQTVTNGSISLPSPASRIVAGLPFQAQVQSLYLDIPGEATVQGKRKKITAVTVRYENSRGAQVGISQPDQATQPYQATVAWTHLVPTPLRTPLIPGGSPIPLYSGDARVLVVSDWEKKGQVAVQQLDPLPMNISSFQPEISVGDTNST